MQKQHFDIIELEVPKYGRHHRRFNLYVTTEETREVPGDSGHVIVVGDEMQQYDKIVAKSRDVLAIFIRGRHTAERMVIDLFAQSDDDTVTITQIETFRS